MTIRQAFEHVLVDTNKVEAPATLLDDFNYLFMKGVYQYTNKQYNIYDTSQQSKDNLRVLETSSVLTPTNINSATQEPDNDYYEFYLPSDYYHILGCDCTYIIKGKFDCYGDGDTFRRAAGRMTSDMRFQIDSNYYMRPRYNTPYYFIHNRNNSNEISTNLWDNTGTNSGLGIGTDSQSGPTKEQSGPTNNLSKADGLNSLVNKQSARRYGNASAVRLEVHYNHRSRKNSNFKLSEIVVDYLKVPQHILLTPDQIDLVEDTSQIIEFPDYVCYEIINEMGKLLLENASDPRLQTFIPVNQSIAIPSQADSK